MDIDMDMDRAGQDRTELALGHNRDKDAVRMNMQGVLSCKPNKSKSVNDKKGNTTLTSLLSPSFPSLSSLGRATSFLAGEWTRSETLITNDKQMFPPAMGWDGMGWDESSPETPNVVMPVLSLDAV